MAAIHECVSRVFATRNAAHIAHWNTKSFAQHVALGDFYDGLIDIIDELVETYQGNFGPIGLVAPSQSDPKLDIIQVLAQDADWIAKNRGAIAGGITALENILDELVGLYLKTIYKLKNLS